MTQYLDFEGLKEFKKMMDSKISSIPGASVSPKFTAITVATEDGSEPCTHIQGGNIDVMADHSDDTSTMTSITSTSITTPKIIKAGGTSSEILMADGSVKDFVSLSSIPLTGSINLTTENAVTLAAKYAKVANNSINFYVIADSRGKLPSSETRININSGIASLVGAEGANVGDLFVVGKLSLKPVYKIIPLNDAKAENSTYKGTQGVVTPWDKQQINKVASIESTANAAKNNMPTYGESNMNNALRSGMYPWCTLGRPSGSQGAYTCVVLASTTADSNGYTTVEQTAYGRQNEKGKIYKRIIFVKSGVTEYGDWIAIG